MVEEEKFKKATSARHRIIVYVLAGVGAFLLQLYGLLTRQPEQILPAADVPRISSSLSSSSSSAFESLSTKSHLYRLNNNHNRTTTSHDDDDDTNDDENVVHLLPGHFFPSCHATANARYIKSIQQERTQKDQPHFSSIVRSPCRFESNSTRLYWTAIFNLVPSIWKPGRERIRDERWINAATVVWECDGKPAILVAGGCPAGTGFAIQCPQEPQERISKLTVFPVNYSLAKKMTYRVKDHVDCEVDHPLRVPPENATIVGTAYLFGDMASSPHHLLEWIEYHRFIGVHHFYIYLVKEFTEEEWNVLPNLPYITYIPWDMLEVFTIRARAEVLSFQIAQQTDVLYRSRGANIQWVTYNDIDEYIQITRKNNDNNNTNRLLDLEPFVRRNPDLGALMGLTVNFGYQYANESYPPDYTMEYAYRAIQPIRGARQKCLVRPGYIDYYNNHRVSLGNETVHLKPFYHLRYNHYKKPNSGVFLKFQPEKVVVPDSSLRDAFLERLKVRVDAVKKSMIQANGGKIRSEWTHFDHLVS